VQNGGLPDAAVANEDEFAGNHRHQYQLNGLWSDGSVRAKSEETAK
jgi:hypothetical protein